MTLQTNETRSRGARPGSGYFDCLTAFDPEITQPRTEKQRQFSPTGAVKVALIRDLLSESLSIAIQTACKAIQSALSGDDLAILVAMKDFHAASRVAFQAARELRDAAEGDSA